MSTPFNFIVGLTTLVVCISFGGHVSAQVEGGFEAADLNRNKKISARELGKYIKKRVPNFQPIKELMKELDSDSDGNLSRSEFAKRMEGIEKIQPASMRRQGTDNEAPGKSGKPEKETKPVVEFADKYNEMFSEKDPKVGDTISGVAAYDENGKPFNLDQLKGDYTVLVFGCLT